MSTPSFPSWLMALSVMIGPGCTQHIRLTEVSGSSAADADSQSGPEGLPGGAVRLERFRDDSTDVPIDLFEGRGEVSWPAHRRTHWLRIELDHAPIDEHTPLRCELRATPETAQLHLDAWSESGVKLPEHHDTPPGLYVAEIFLDKPAPVLLRIQAERPEYSARFAVHCSWHCREDPAPRHRYHGVPKPKPQQGQNQAPPDPWEMPENPRQVRILSAVRQEDKLILRLDQGSSAGVKVGQRGTVLSGKSGLEPLEGGRFQTLAVTERESVAEVMLKSLGNNKRAVIFSK